MAVHFYEALAPSSACSLRLPSSVDTTRPRSVGFPFQGPRIIASGARFRDPLAARRGWLVASIRPRPLLAAAYARAAAPRAPRARRAAGIGTGRCRSVEHRYGRTAPRDAIAAAAYAGAGHLEEAVAPELGVLCLGEHAANQRFGSPGCYAPSPQPSQEHRYAGYSRLSAEQCSIA